MMAALVCLFGCGYLWQTPEWVKGIAGRVCARLFAFTFLAVGILALFAWLGAA